MLQFVILLLACLSAATAAPGYLTGHHAAGPLFGAGYAHLAAPSIGYGHADYGHSYAAAPAILHAAPIAKIAAPTFIAQHSYAAAPAPAFIKSYAAPVQAYTHQSYAAPTLIKSYAPAPALHYAAPASYAHAAYPAHSATLQHAAPLLSYGGLHNLHGASLAHGW